MTPTGTTIGWQLGTTGASEKTMEAAVKRLVACDVLRLFELAGVHAEVPVGRAQQALEIVERQPFVGCQGADDPEPQTLVDKPIEVERAALHRLRYPWRANR